MSRRAHWDDVWTRRDPQDVSWYQTTAARSLRLIEAALDQGDGAILDVGGGASRLVDDLLAHGHHDLSVLDISEAALDQARRRLGDAASDVRWLVGDVTSVGFERTYAVWHDRAVLHFLTDVEDQRRYVTQLRRALAPGGHAVIATFAPDGPDSCSGLPVQRYGPEDLQGLLGEGFEPVTFEREVHVTPAGGEQAFTYGLFRAGA